MPKPKTIAPEDLVDVIRLTVQRLAPLSLTQIIAGIHHADPCIHPAIIHDVLNTLLAEGVIELSANGHYCAP